MTLTTLTKPAGLAAVLLCALALASCGESAQDKAKAQVCAARGEISKQITKLEELKTFSPSTISEAEAGFGAIGKELTTIKNAQSALAPARKEQIQAATRAFEADLSSVVGGLLAGLGSGSLEAQLKNAEPQLKSALSKLAADYQQALGPISCP